MTNSTEFTCKCGKIKGWITDGKIHPFPCPHCNRVYKGVYNKDTLDIEAVEIKETDK